MNYDLKSPGWSGQSILICLIIVGILIVFFPFSDPGSQGVKADLALVSEDLNSLAKIEGNSLLPISNPSNPQPRVTKKIRVVATAYSSTPWETDDSPYLTAAGTLTREGVVANNKYPFGTKIRIPEIYGDKVFVVEDRMHWRKGDYHFDIWFPSYLEAKNFGAKRTYIEVLEG